ncbi:MAG: IS1595 family transposase [Patescibacteria group bacterium]
MIKFTIQDFNTKYPNEEACIEEIFNQRFSSLTECPTCKNPFKYYKVTDRKCYACQFCGNQIHPLANTIFHKSETSIKSWFYAIFLFSTSKNGVSAMELQRQLGFTYKTAWRIAKQIRQLFKEANSAFSKTTELDETYIGGKGGNNKRGRGSENKTPVFGMVERKGSIKATVVGDTKMKTVMPIIRGNVALGTEIMTDEYLPYRSLTKEGYKHQTVNHGSKEYVRGDVHTNTLEGFWSQLKRSINGTYHAVSPKYLQTYVNEFSYRYNRRFYPIPLFHLMLSRV